MTANTFKPKQFPAISPQVLDEIQGGITKQTLQYALTLIPPIQTSSIVHDNTCGTGHVTETIAASCKPRKLYAADVVSPFVPAVAQKAQQNRWNFVEAKVMNAMELDVPVDGITHSFTDFLLQSMPHPGKAVEEIYRTVAPGGVAVVSTWATVPHMEAIEAASEVTRGKGVDLPMRFTPERFTEEWLRGLLGDAGFGSVDVT